jgi:MSHA pilin protein MshA
LAATALPKFVDLKADADIAATAGVAGGLSSSGVTNYALRTLHSASGTPVTTTLGCNGVAWANLMEGGIPAGYTVAASGANTTSSLSCKVTSNITGTTGATGFSLPLIN